MSLRLSQSSVESLEKEHYKTYGLGSKLICDPIKSYDQYCIWNSDIYF